MAVTEIFNDEHTLIESDRLLLLHVSFFPEEEIVLLIFFEGWHPQHFTIETAMETTDTTNLSRLVANYL